MEWNNSVGTDNMSECGKTIAMERCGKCSSVYHSTLLMCLQMGSLQLTGGFFWAGNVYHSNIQHIVFVKDKPVHRDVLSSKLKLETVNESMLYEEGSHCPVKCCVFTYINFGFGCQYRGVGCNGKYAYNTIQYNFFVTTFVRVPKHFCILMSCGIWWTFSMENFVGTVCMVLGTWPMHWNSCDEECMFLDSGMSTLFKEQVV